MAPPDTEQASKSITSTLTSWGTSSIPPTGLATLVIALHGRPLQPFPLLFAPALFFASYVHLAGYPTDGAALTAAWSGLYAILALRRGRPWRAKLSPRGLVRGSAIGLGTTNAAAGSWVYMNGDRKADEAERTKKNRWGEKA